MGGALAIALKGKKLPTFDFDIKPSDAVNQVRRTMCSCAQCACK